MHLSDALSIEMFPVNDVASAYPLRAPLHSDVDVVQAPSTQAPLWTTSSEMVRGSKFIEDSVPVHFPATFTAGTLVVGGLGDGFVTLDDIVELEQSSCSATLRRTHQRTREPWEPAFMLS